MNEIYRKQVSLLIRILPSIYKIQDFAVHGGTAINLFLKSMPRYSVDIDITYIPIKSREDSFTEINSHLLGIKKDIERSIPGVNVLHREKVLKLLCTKDGATVKIEVNNIKRGLIGKVIILQLCEKAKSEFRMSCIARIVPISQLYGGKISAALNRQHPRDIFDFRNMDEGVLLESKNGLIYNLISSSKPIIESLCPNPINQHILMENQFKGMTDMPFTYDDYLQSRSELIEQVNSLLNPEDKDFLLSFEQGNADWDKCCAGNLSKYPSVIWKTINVEKLKTINPEKYRSSIEKLENYFNN